MKNRLPEWIKKGIIDTEKTRTVRKILRESHLNTVCDSARCPNKSECYSKNTATFMILGNTCTRNCHFCSINTGMPDQINPDEPYLIAKAVKELKLDYVVITSVTRDDLEDGGAGHFAEVIKELRKLDLNIKIEVLTPDFQGNITSIDKVIETNPDIFNHNIETVKSLYSKVRPQAEYSRSLEFIKNIKEANPEIYTKSGFMVGLGETYDEIIELLKDLKEYNCDIVTVGQYIQPTKNHLKVQKYLTPQEFEKIKQDALSIGIKYPVAAPLVRSSYKAKECFAELDPCQAE